MDGQFAAWADVTVQYDDEPHLAPSGVAAQEQRQRVLNYCENPDPMLEDHPTTVQILVSLKHQRAWERLASGDLPSPLLIVEDDVRLDAALPTRLREYMAELPSDYDVAWLHRSYSLLQSHPVSPEQPHIFASSRSEGGHAYLITREAAEKFLAKLPMRGIVCLPSDLWQNTLLPDMRNFVLEPNLAHDEGFEYSTIWADSSRPSVWAHDATAESQGQTGKTLVQEALALEATRSDTAAAEIYAKAAAAPYRNAQAQVNLGVLWKQGRGVLRQDSKEAMRLWIAAANQGFAQALCNLGNLFFTGDGVDQSHTEAARLFQTAVVMETPPSGEALFKLGLMHEHGIGVPASDLTKAMQYYSAAARVGNEHAPGLLRALQEKQK